MMISGWGRFPQIDGNTTAMRDAADAERTIRTQPSLIARGNGRAYGDAALNDSCMLSTLKSDRILAFDPALRLVTCEAGLLLADLLDFAVPRGLFPPVTPGTKFVTVGGMIAADVHGKNHHGHGSFCSHVDSLLVMTAAGTVLRCSAKENAELFAAACGGMGLVGLILEASFRLVPIETAVIRQETLRAANIDEAMALCEASAGWTYTVAWIDCLARGARLGRGLVHRGEHVRRGEAADAGLAVPKRRRHRVLLDFPRWALSAWSVRAFNEIHFRQGKPGTDFVDYDTFFYPLDGLLDWNRIYGKNGLLQYQCVVPKDAAREAVGMILERVAAAGKGSFLAVLKQFGPGGEGLLSFPMEGYTLALDFAVDAAALDLLGELDAIVADHGGRLYLAKDARMSGAMMRRCYPRLDRFLAVRERVDPQRKFASLLSQRLAL